MGTEWIMMGSAVVDVIAVVALSWMLSRSSRLRDAMLVDQRQTLERLRGDLTQLLEDATDRARGLERTLDSRERTLRRLLGEIEREPRVAAPAAPAPAVRFGERERPLASDPAEARLLRDLERRFAEQEGR